MCNLEKIGPEAFDRFLRYQIGLEDRIRGTLQQRVFEMMSSSTPKSEDEEFVIVQEVHANESETPLIRGTPSQTVRELKEAIANTTESELDEILLAFATSDLNDSKALSCN